MKDTYEYVHDSHWRASYRRFREHKVAVASFIIVIIIGLICLLAPYLTKYSYDAQDLAIAGGPPSKEHWFGTDTLGRDVLSRILYGGRISFLVGGVATLVSLSIGVTYGAISGWYGGKVDRIMMRIVEIIYSLPYAVLIILLMVYLGRGLVPLFFAIGAVEWLIMARIVRGQVLAIKEQSFVDAARILGQSQSRILIKHLLPNITTTVIICITLTIPAVLLTESFISFLGLGVQAPMTSWGDLIKEGANSMESYPWLLIFPSLFFSLTLFCLNFFGDGLRGALDPHA